MTERSLQSLRQLLLALGEVALIPNLRSEMVRFSRNKDLMRQVPICLSILETVTEKRLWERYQLMRYQHTWRQASMKRITWTRDWKKTLAIAPIVGLSCWWLSIFYSVGPKTVSCKPVMMSTRGRSFQVMKNNATCWSSQRRTRSLTCSPN